MKITIIGPSGSGKSFLAKKISAKFNLPMMEIDRIWFKHSGHEFLNSTDTKQKELIAKKIQTDVEDFISKHNSWVSDGSYSKIQTFIATQADAVIFINRPLIKRVLSHLIRSLEGKNRHPEVTKWQDLNFTKTIIRRWVKGENKKLEAFANMFQDKLVILKDFKEIDAYYNSLGKV